MKKSYITILLLLMVMILGISAVSAADIDDTSELALTQDDSTPLEVEDTSDDVQTASDTEVIADAGDGNNFTSLKTLINEASDSLTLNKDYTRVAGDSDIEINKDFTIDGQETYTIDANNLGGIFKVNTGYTLTLKGVTLINGNSDNGGAVYVENGATLNAENCKFNQNTAVYYGGAIYSKGTVDVKDSIFKDNDITDRTTLGKSGGAAIANIDGALTVDNSEFTDNVKDYVIRGTDGQAGDILAGGAIFSSGDTSISNSDFFNNSGTYGGALAISPITSKKDATITIDNSNFTDNLAYTAGAAFIGDGSNYQYSISNSWFENNIAMGIGSSGFTTGGGAISLMSNSGSGSITKSTFKGNTVKGGAHPLGGAIDMENSGSVNIDECVFEGNEADYAGGAIFINGGRSSVTIEGSNFTDNAASYGNSIYNFGGLTLTGNDFAAGQNVVSSATISGTFTDLQNQINNAQDTLGLAYDFAFVEGYDDAYANGVVIANPITINGNGYTISGSNAARIFNVTSGTLTLNDLSITNGAASDGAAVYINSGAKLDATDVTFRNNVALDNGGAIYSDGGEINLENCVLDSNDVTNLETSAAQNMGGAAIYAKNAQVTLVNTNVTNNGRSELDRSNGDLINAVINLINSDASITGGLFENNTGIYGGAIYAEGDGTQTLTVDGATFNNNKAYNGAAIDIDHGMITSISDSAFNNNLVVGPGSSGYYGAGGAIAVGGTGSFSLTDSNFTANQATGVGATGGAVHSSLEVKDAAIISGCEFTDNTATDRGSAIFNNGYVSLSDNVIDDELGIYSIGQINSQVFVIFMDNETHTFDAYDNVNAYAKVVDDNGNIIKVDSITLAVSGFTSAFGGTLFAFSETDNLYHATVNPTKTGMGATVSAPLKKQFATVTVLSQIMTVNPTDRILEVTFDENIVEGTPLTVNVKLTRAKDGTLISYNTVSITIDNVTKSVSTRNGVGSVTFENLTWGNYVVNASVKGSTSYNPNEELGDLTVSPVKGTFTDLQYIIDNDEIGLVSLPYDFKYDPEYDADLIDGILIDKDIAIDGNGYTINGNNAARIFKVTEGNTLALTDASLVNGYAEYGGAIYVDASTLVLNDCIIDSNDVFDLTGSNPNELGGAAIHAVDSTVTITDSYITNNGDRTLDRSNDQVINGAVNLINSDTTITGTLFENNTGIYGGAVFAKDGSLDVSDSQFINNIAYVGAGIRTEGTTLTVTGSKFEENEGRGTGSEGTSKNSGAAICSNGVASISITESNFTRNSAENGGAINTNVISSSNTVEIDNCVFTDNVATEKGGAILVNNDAAETIISNSNFTGNDGVLGSAIFNLGTLSLSKNNVDNAGAIANYNVIASNVIITVLDNENATYNTYDKIEDFYAQLTDDNGNVIVTADQILKIGFGTSVLSLEYDETDGLYHKANVKVVKSGAPSLRPETKNLFTDITFESPYITAIKLNATLEVEYENVTDQDDVVISITLTGKEGETAISTTSSSKFTITVNNVPYSVTITKGIGSLTISDLPVGDYVINASWNGNTYYNPIEQLYNLTVGPKKGTFTDLQNIIDNDEIGLVFLPYDFKYDPDYDANLVNGVVIDKNLYILGNDYTIDANNSARIFNVTNGAIFKIDDATLTNGRADYGGAVYVDAGSFFNTQNVVLYNNTATYRGGAIYSEGTVDVYDSVLDSNDITFRTANDDNGGAAIYNLKGDLSIINSNITNNLKDIVIRNGNAGDLLVGVVVTSGYTFIEDSYFANNTGSWGGAISSLGYMNDESYILSVKNTKFEGNNATFGGAIFVESSKLVVDNCTFENNKGVGVGSSGTSETQGGAIVIFPEGASATITDSTFIANSANAGGAVSLAGVDGDSLIENCTFTDNTANDGGAVYLWTQDTAVVTVANSTFSGNTAGWGNAISTDGALALSNNIISSSSADIGNWGGSITSYINATFLGNQTISAELGDVVLLTATLTDDNGNVIIDHNLLFSVNGETIEDINIDRTTGVYSIEYTIVNAGINLISTNYELDGMEIFTGILDVPKANVTEFTVLAPDTLEGENATVWITLRANETGLNSTVTVIVNNKEYAVPVENGIGNLTVEDLAHGQYAAVAMFNDPNYNSEINSSVFFVKGQAKLNVTELTVAEYGDVIEIAINLTDSEGNPLSGIVVVDNINILVDEGIGTFVIDDQPGVGEYTFQAVYDGDNDYFGGEAPFNVIVTTKVIDPSDIVVDIPNINEFGEAIPITITSPVDGTYTVNINGTEVNVEVINGTGNATITIDNPGIYNATVDIAEEGYSLETITTDEFEYLVTPKFNVVITGTYPEAEISITGPAGTYHVTMDGMEPVDITREESGLPTLVTITDLDAGDYTAYVSFDARDEYYGDYKEINFTVNKAALNIEGPEVIGDKVVENLINITFTLPADVDPSNVATFMNGAPVPITYFIINGTTGVYTLEIGFASARNHLFSVEVNDPNYEEDGAQVTFTIEKITPTLEVNDTSAVWDTPVDIPVKLTDANGNPITGKVIVTVSWIVDGVTQVVNLDENGEGIASFNINQAVGDLTIDVTFDGNDKYNATKANATLYIADIIKMIVDADSQVNYNDTFYVNVTLTGAMDEPLADAVVSYAINEGETQTISTDENGYVSIPVTGLAAGESSIVVSYDDESGDVTTKTVAVNVNQILPVFTSEASENNVVGQKVTITVNAPDATGNVTLTVDGELVGRDALVDGVVVFEVSGLDAGHHSYQAIYEGNENYTTTSDLNSFDVAKAETTVTIEVDGEIGVMGGATVNVTVSNNVTGYISIDNDGAVSVVEITNGTYSFEIYDLQAGDYSITVTFLGNDNYLKSNATKVLNVPKSAATPEIYDVRTNKTLGNDVLIFVDMNNSLISGNVTVFVDGVENQTVALDDGWGMALARIPGLTIGNHTIGVRYNGDDNYNASDIVTLTVNVAKANSTVTIDPIDSVTYGEEVFISYTIENQTNVKITVYDNTGVITPVMETADGIIAIKGLKPGDYQISIENEESDEYKSSFEMGYFTVGKADSTVTIDPIDNVTYGEEVMILYTVGNQTNVKILVYEADAIIEPEMEIEDGIITIKDLAPGNYEIFIENEESDEYKSSFAMAYFTVGKAASSVTIVEIDDLVYPGNGEVLYEIKNKTEHQSFIVTFNGNVIPVPYDEESIQLTNLDAGEYTITIKNLEDDLYNGSEATISFKVLKADPTFTSNVTENAKVGENVTITVKAPEDATGNVTVTVDGEIVAIDIPVINGNATVNVTGLAAGHHSYEVTYNGDDNYEIASDLNSFDVVKNTPKIIIDDIENPVVGNTVQTTVTVAGGNATGYVIFDKVAYKLENGKATIDVGISEAGMQTIAVEYLGDDKYSNVTATKAFTAAKAPTTITTDLSEITEVIGRDVEIKYTIDPMVGKGNVSVWLNDKLISNEEIYVSSGDVIIKADDLPTNGTYTVKVQYIGTKDYADSENATVVLKIVDEHVDINITVPENTTVPVFNITVPTDATGLLLVDIDGKHYYAPVENGTASISVPGLEPGNYTANVTYTGDEFYDPLSKTVDITIPANADENSITIPEGATTTNPTFSIDLPSDATGYFEVDVDGKKYVVPVENGTAKISVPGLAPGNHNVTVKYSGDSKYNSISKSTTLKLKEPVAKLSENKYIKVVYSGKATYKVRLTLDGKAAAGKYVTINFNGKNYKVKTDSKGYATLKLNTKVKPKKYTVTATYKGVKVTSKVKVKHVIKAKNMKAKKSKKLKIKIKLYKVNGKVLKNKKVKLKFKGKKYTAKTNKKGKATFTIKKKVMKKLKKGKKYKYKVYYGKDKVTKKIKVKK